MDLGDQGGTAWCLEKLAIAAFDEKYYEKSVKIFGAADAIRTPLNSVIDKADLSAYKRIISDLQSSLGKESYEAIWAKGESMQLEEVIEEALTSSKETRQSEKEKYGGLSPREREVAVFIADGKTNREIADEMSVTAKTIETYVTRILNKLGFDSRVQVATWVMDKGLK
jgi:non-specific serine/threonine protein kinase